MKEDLITQNTRVSNDITGINNKIDDVLSTVHQLKTDYNDLKRDNINLQNEVSQLHSKIDQIENQSRRNNLRFSGISGQINEKWEITEQKLREFLRTTLNFGAQADQFDIDRAHRVKSHDASSCTIIARFTRFKDCQSIIDRANNVFKGVRNPRNFVQQDYSDRVKRHRRILGEKMIYERQQGNYASIRFDKLFVNDSIFKYDDSTDRIIHIGKRAQFRPRAQSPRVQTTRGHTNSGDDSRRLVPSQREDRDVGAHGTPAEENAPISDTTETPEDDLLSD